MMRLRGRTQRWSVIAVVAVAVLATVSGCRNELVGVDVEENESEPEAYTVSFDRQGGAGGSTSVTVTLGSPMPPAMAPVKAGVVFDGYYAGLNGNGTQYYTSAMESSNDWGIPADTELIANWVYPIGSTGPAGGIVFYDKGEFSDGWRFLEAWIADEGEYRWKTEKTATVTSTEIGSGHANTYNAMTGIEHPAAEVMRNATHGGHSDWFLPSKDELDLMRQNLYMGGKGGFTSDTWYWSSSEYDDDVRSAWRQRFDSGLQLSASKLHETNTLRVRAARSF